MEQDAVQISLEARGFDGVTPQFSLPYLSGQWLLAKMKVLSVIADQPLFRAV